MTPPLTVAEVVALSGMDEGPVRKDVELGLCGPDTPPTFTLNDLVYFRTLTLIDIQLGVEDRRKIHTLISKSLRLGKPANVEMGPVLELKLAKVAKEVTETLDRFTAWKKKIVVNPKILGGEPVFPNTRLSVRHIGSLVMNEGLDEIHEDYPYLSEKDIEFARLYTLAYPKRGRPRTGKASTER